MWTYTAYILREYCREKSINSLKFEGFYDFLSNVLWRKEHLSFHENRLVLYDDLEYLSRLKILSLSGNEGIVYEKDGLDKIITTNIGKKIDDVIKEVIITIINQQGLDNLSKVVENTDKAGCKEIYEEYNKRIKSAIFQISD